MVKLRVSVKELVIIVRDCKSIASLGFCFIWDSFWPLESLVPLSIPLGLCNVVGPFRLVTKC